MFKITNHSLENIDVVDIHDIITMLPSFLKMSMKNTTSCMSINVVDSYLLKSFWHFWLILFWHSEFEELISGQLTNFTFFE